MAIFDEVRKLLLNIVPCSKDNLSIMNCYKNFVNSNPVCSAVTLFNIYFAKMGNYSNLGHLRNMVVRVYNDDDNREKKLSIP